MNELVLLLLPSRVSNRIFSLIQLDVPADYTYYQDSIKLYLDVLLIAYARSEMVHSERSLWLNLI
jgi:hypothetical protein